MKKVKLTQEQAKAIEYALQGVIKYRVNPDKLLLHASMDNVIFHNVLEPLNTIDVATLAKALYIGYEVEPEFKIGDWVVYRHDNTIWEIVGELYGGNVHYDITRDGKHKGPVHKDHIRLATPDEIAKEKRRRWWARHGREVWELKEGDVLKHEYYITYVAGVDSFEYVIVGDEDEIRVDKDDHERLERVFKVVCFAEDRKDR